MDRTWSLHGLGHQRYAAKLMTVSVSSNHPIDLDILRLPTGLPSLVSYQLLLTKMQLLATFNHATAAALFHSQRNSSQEHFSTPDDTSPALSADPHLHNTPIDISRN